MIYSSLNKMTNIHIGMLFLLLLINLYIIHSHLEKNLQHSDISLNHNKYGQNGVLYPKGKKRFDYAFYDASTRDSVIKHVQSSWKVEVGDLKERNGEIESTKLKNDIKIGRRINTECEYLSAEGMPNRTVLHTHQHMIKVDKESNASISSKHTLEERNTSVDTFHGVRRYTHTHRIQTDETPNSLVSFTSTTPTAKIRKTRELSSKDPCAFTGTCRANENKVIGNCYCDYICHLYKDCCFDAKIDTVPNNFREMRDIMRYQSCEVTAIPPLNLRSNRGFYMVTECPLESTSSDAKRKCEIKEVEYNLPVTNSNGITYKNKYCAMCHNVDQYEYWTVMFDIDGCKHFKYTSVNETSVAKRIETIRKAGCHMYTLPSSLFSNTTIYPRMCIKEEKTPYTQNDETCNNYWNPVLMLAGAESIFIKNYFCMKEKRPYLCIDNNDNAYYNQLVHNNWMTLPMTVMFQFYPQPQKDTQNDCLTTNCTATEMYSKETIRNYDLSYEVFMEMEIKSYWFMDNYAMSQSTFQRATFLYFYSLPVEASKLNFQTGYGKVRCGENILLNGTNCCTLILTLDVLAGREMNQQEVITLHSSSLEMRFKYKETSVNSLSEHLVTSKVGVDKVTCHLKQDVTISRMMISSAEFKRFQNIFDKGPYSTNHRYAPFLSSVEAQVDFSSEQKLSTGLLLETAIKIVNWTMTFPNVQSINVSSVVEFLSERIQIIITYLSMSLSSVALAITICILTYLNLNKHIPGHICMNIMCCLLFADVIFMLGIGATDDQMLCSIIGILLHYLWLAVFTWISIYSLVATKMMVMLDKNLSYDPESGFSKKLLYCLGHGIPLIIITFCILVENFDIFPFKIGYNGQICFPTDFPANLIFYTGPVSLSLAVNLVLLVVSSRILSRYSSTVLLRSARSTLSYVSTYMRFCGISGLFYVFGILAQSLNNEILAYIYIILSGSHGLIISVCFLTSDRICRIISRKRRKRKENKTQGKDTELKEVDLDNSKTEHNSMDIEVGAVNLEDHE